MTSKVSPSGIVPPGNQNGESFHQQSLHIGPETSYRTNCKGLKLHCSYWKPNEKHIKGLTFICHGFGEHLQWYEELAVLLVSCGILAFGHDHVGHGRSEGARGHVTSIQEYINDTLDHCEQMKKEYKGLPCYIVGHSMGGMIGIRAATIKAFDGVVLIGPLIQPNPDEATPFKIRLAKVVASVRPLMTVGKLNLNHVTRDEEMRKKLSKDPLRYNGGIRARWAMACHEELFLLQESMNKVTWPFLILHGAKDRICSPSASELFYKDARSTDKKVMIIPHAYHHLYIEIPEVRREALESTVAWINDRLSKSTPLLNGTKS